MRDGCFASAAFPQPYRKVSELLADLPIEPAEGHVTVRQRMLTAGARLEEQSLRQEPDIPPMTCEHKQLEFCMPDDPLGEFVVSIDTAHVRRPRAISKLPWRAEGADRPPGQYFASAKYQIPEMRR
jgi:hypothetical protein